MRILNQYLGRQIIGFFIVLLLVLTGLAWMLQILSMLKFLITYGISVGGFLGLTFLMVPFIVSIIMPFVIFIAVMFVYNKMIASGEVTVMAGGGLSPRQIAKPALKIAGFLTVVHLVLNIWTVPDTQARFYDTQWEMRYGLAHLKLQEAAFTQMTDGLVVYVDKVSNFDLFQLMLSDERNKDSEMVVFAEKGKLVATPRGLSIVMTNGSLQAKNDALAVGTFDTFDMDMNVADREGESVFKVRRIPTRILVRDLLHNVDARQHKQSLSELANRFLGPIMNVILVLIGLVVLLRASLLRRRASLAPVLAVGAMAGAQAAFMSSTNIITSVTGLGVVFAVQAVVLGVLITALFKK